MELLLEVIEGASTGNSVRLKSGQHITVGRTIASEFVVPDTRVGRHHFTIVLTPYECRIHDLDTMNERHDRERAKGHGCSTSRWRHHHHRKLRDPRHDRARLTADLQSLSLRRSCPLNSRAPHLRRITCDMAIIAHQRRAKLSERLEVHAYGAGLV